MTGANVFFDYDEEGNARASVGVELRSSTFEVLGNLISDFSRLLKQEATRIPSGQHRLDKEYYNSFELF